MFIYRQIFIAYIYSTLVCVHQPFLFLLLNRHAPDFIHGLEPIAKSTELNLRNLTCFKSLRINNMQVQRLMLLNPFLKRLNRLTMVKEKNCLHVGYNSRFCHYYFPACDRTGPTIQERKPCKASCDYFMKTCKKEVELDEKILHTHIDCSIFPIREAGSSPECWYYDGQLNGKLKTFQKYLHKKNLHLIIVNCLHAAVCYPFLLKSVHLPLMPAIFFLTIFRVVSHPECCLFCLLNAPLISIKRLFIVSKVKPKT